MTPAVRVEALLARHWWQPRPTVLARVLQPLAWLYGLLAARDSARRPLPLPLPVPVVVVGNYVAGGAGKTPAVIALVQALREAGHRPGVVSRGYGRSGFLSSRGSSTRSFPISSICCARFPTRT